MRLGGAFNENHRIWEVSGWGGTWRRVVNLVKNGANGKFWEIPALTLGDGRPHSVNYWKRLTRAICETFNEPSGKKAKEFISLAIIGVAS